MEQLLRDDGFLIALVAALAGSAALALAHHRSRFVVVEAGMVATLAALVALFATDRRAMLSLPGLVLIGVGAALGRRFPGPWAALACVPGALLLGLGLDAPVPDWARWTCVLAVAVAPMLVVATDRGSPQLLPLLLAATAAGMWATTPDTEHTRVMVGALVGVTVLALDRRLRAGAAGTAAITGLLVWAAVLDGSPRRSAVVGALACFGAAVLLPLVRRTRVPRRLISTIVVVAVQVAVVVVCARVAGLRTSAVAALAISAVTLAAAALVLRVASGRTGSRGSG